MLDELNVFKQAIQKLNENSIPYMVSGSVAMNYYSIPRMTRDIDIVIEIDNPEKFYNLFKDSYYINYKSFKKAVSEKKMFNIININEVIKIDFILRKDSEYRKLEFGRRIKKKIDNFFIYLATIEDLILSKILWSKESLSDIQLNDVKNLLEQKEIDFKYIKKWAEKLGVSNLLKKISP